MPRPSFLRWISFRSCAPCFLALLTPLDMARAPLEIEIANRSRPAKSGTLLSLVDFGAIYCVAPARVLRRLGIRPLAKEEFLLAHESKIISRPGRRTLQVRRSKRPIGCDLWRRGRPSVASSVDPRSMGLSLDPLKRELVPLPMILGAWRPADRAGRRERLAGLSRTRVLHPRTRRRGLRNLYLNRRLKACGPLSPGRTSNCTSAPSRRSSK